jgi:ribonuclease G
MSQEILINVTPHETRAALLEDGVLQEVYLERASRRGIVGNLYKGRVSRVLPGMQAAFIEVGLQRTAFLHASDIAGAVSIDADGEREERGISELLHEGDEILVQILKEPLGTKGARLTTDVTIPSRFLVYMPYGEGVGISNRIEDPDERDRLREMAEAQRPEGARGGLIVRTVAEGAAPEALRADLTFLRRHWDVLEERAREISAPALVHADLPLPTRMLRDHLGSRVRAVRVDDQDTHDQMSEFMRMFAPEGGPELELFEGTASLFDINGVEEEIRRALDRKVKLKSGGYLMIDQTEALTTIDINTGGFVGHRNLEETIFKTNLEATQAIARQLRLRNLGGIIIIDFIDMEVEAHREQVLASLETYLAPDHARTQVSQVSTLGLVEMTRKRTRESLEHLLCEPCPTCTGRSSIRSAETVCYEIYREVLREARQFKCSELMVIAAETVVDLLLEEEAALIADLEEATGRPVRLQAETSYGQEQYDVVMM